jgi:hypothetical protein
MAEPQNGAGDMVAHPHVSWPQDMLDHICRIPPAWLREIANPLHPIKMRNCRELLDMRSLHRSTRAFAQLKPILIRAIAGAIKLKFKNSQHGRLNIFMNRTAFRIAMRTIDSNSI